MAVMTAQSNPRLDQAKRELARRLRLAKAREHLIDFCNFVDPDAGGAYAAPHLKLIAEYLEKAETGELWAGMQGHGKRILCITTPPRHWKSSLISRKFPAWFVGKRVMGKRPHQFILASYAASLAESHSRAVLETIMDQPLYREVFPQVVVSDKSHAIDEWALAGEPFPTGVAAGVGGGLTGHGADVLIIDDPVKDRTEANSLASQKRLWQWWEDVARTRMNPDSYAVIVMTRWHPEDLVGKLLTQAKNTEGEGERIVVLRLPALAETEAERLSAVKMGLPYDEVDPLGRKPGQALWPSRVFKEELEATRRNTPRTFEALYQNRPTPDGGYVVNREQIKILPTAPTENIRWVWGTDWAITEKEAANTRKDDPDFTTAALVGLWKPTDDDARIVIAAMYKGQHNVFDARQMVKEALLSTKERYPMYSGQANIDKIVIDQMRRDDQLLNFSMTNLSRKELPGDKMTQAQPWLDRAQGGSVYVVEGYWNEDFFLELENFPKGAHDDQVDAVSVAVAALGMGNKEAVNYMPNVWEMTYGQ